MAYLSGYSKYKVLTLTGGADGALTDHQLKIAVSHEAAMDGEFDDLRFTEADGVTLIDAWAELIVTDTSATVWVEFPTTPANTVEQTYYMYYDHAAPSNYWDIGATFVFGDDVENGDTRTGGMWATTDNKAATDQKRSGTYSAKCTGGYGGSGEFQTKALSLSADGSFALGYYVRIDGTAIHLETYTSDDIFDGGWDPKVGIQINYSRSPPNIHYYDGAWRDSGLDISTNTWEKFEIIHYATNWKIRKNDGAWSSLFGYRNNPAQFDRYGVKSSTSNAWYDDMYIRKYAANPPTYEFGAEESVPTGGTRLPRAFLGPFRGGI